MTKDKSMFDYYNILQFISEMDDYIRENMIWFEKDNDFKRSYMNVTNAYLKFAKKEPMEKLVSMFNGKFGSDSSLLDIDSFKKTIFKLEKLVTKVEDPVYLKVH